MKSCNKCGLSKPLADFQKKASTRDGYARTCRRCDNAIRIERKIKQGKRLPDPPPGMKRCNGCSTTKPIEEFYVRKSGKHEGLRHGRCIPCAKADNTARARTRGVRPRQEADPNSVWRRRLANYKMSLDDFYAMLASQDGKCLGCGMDASDSDRRFAVDHDHKCCPGPITCGNCIRGLLCYSRNFVVGHAYDSPETLDRLATYLRAYAGS